LTIHVVIVADGSKLEGCRRQTRGWCSSDYPSGPGDYVPNDMYDDEVGS